MGSEKQSVNFSNKKRCMDVWNEVAPRYHKKWAGPATGPFGCTQEMLHLVGIKPGNRVLDVACGTGAVTAELVKLVGNDGHIVGADMSKTALSIAKQNSVTSSNLDFINCDAETVKFTHTFDAVTCQFGVFFFPDAPAALLNLKSVIEDGGKLGIVVHGQNTPYYTCFIEEITRWIPDYVKPGMPALDRYSQITPLYDLVSDAGFKDIIVKDITYEFSPGDFMSYWDGYIQYIAKPYREKIESLSDAEKTKLQEAIRNRTIPYTKNNTITFPWQVLILAATV